MRSDQRPSPAPLVWPEATAVRFSTSGRTGFFFLLDGTQRFESDLLPWHRCPHRHLGNSPLWTLGTHLRPPIRPSTFNLVWEHPRWRHTSVCAIFEISLWKCGKINDYGDRKASSPPMTPVGGSGTSFWGCGDPRTSWPNSGSSSCLGG